jgi:hydrogenase maturation protein HypF
MAVSYLAHHFGREFLEFKLPFLDQISHQQVELVVQMAERRVNSPLTSSCGRLFDAIAALSGIRLLVNYEAQAAIELEMAIPDSTTNEGYPFELLLKNDAYIISTRSLFTAVIRDLADQVSAGVISARFHQGLVGVLLDIANAMRDRSGLDRVCLSGGTFNNVYLAESLCQRLRGDRFQVFTQRQVPCGDGGLSLGQAMIGVHSLE